MTDSFLGPKPQIFLKFILVHRDTPKKYENVLVLRVSAKTGVDCTMLSGQGKEYSKI